MALGLGKTVLKVVGVAGVLAGTWVLCSLSAPPPPAPQGAVIRPVCSTLVTPATALSDIRLAGRVKANQSAKLFFKQPGRIARILPKCGDKVKKGEKLAWLEDGDFRDRVNRAQAAYELARDSFARIHTAASKNAVSREREAQAAAAVKDTEAQLALAKRALSESVIVAPFDGVVADVPASELQMQSGSETILLVQDVTRIQIIVSIPETIMIRLNRITRVGEQEGLRVSFDALPGQTYPVTCLEHTTAAQVQNQTFTATYLLANPPADLLLLPGMAATVTLPGKAYRYRNDPQAGVVEVPESALGAGADGQVFVWVLTADGPKGSHRVHRRVVHVADRDRGRGLITEGLAVGERVVTAGVSALTEGCEVNLIEHVQL